MITVIKRGNAYNRRVISLEGLSTDTKPVEYFIETDSNGVEVARVYIENGSTFTEIDTGKLFMYDAENTVWYEIETIGGGGGGGFTPTDAQLAAMNSGIDSTKVQQISTNETNISKQQDTIADGGNGYALINGKRLYLADSAPTGNIPDGSIGVGW